MALAVIANPRSKAHLRDPRAIDRLRHVIAGRGEVHAPGDREALAGTCADLAARGVDLVAVHGGDGTLHVTLGALSRAFRSMPRVAILPAGTLNTVAAGLGLSGEPLGLLDRVASAHASGRVATRRRPLMQIGKELGFIFGHGLIANFMQAYYDTGNPSPAMGALLVARGAASATFGGPLAKKLFARPRVRVTCDGQRWPHDEHATIACATVPEIGIGFAPFPRVLERDDAFQVVGFHCSPAQIVGLLPRIRAGAPLPPARATTALCQSLVLEGDEPFSYVVDGDLYGPVERLELSMGPVVDLVVPAQSPS